MNKPASLALLAIGVILIIYGAAASESLGSGLSRLFTGAPTEKTIWLLVGGFAAAVGGLVGLITRSK